LLNRKNELLKGMSWREIADGGKWMAEGKLLKGGLLKGKELLKENCWSGVASKSKGQDFKKTKENVGQSKSAPRTLYLDFRKAKLKKSWRVHGTVQVWGQTLREIMLKNS
jgi:hypothetical protein